MESICEPEAGNVITEIQYPSIVRRYLSSFIDGMFIIVACIIVSYIFQQNNDITVKFRVGLIILLAVTYEPVCTSKFCTLGQKITVIRIRRLPDYKRLGILSAFLRSIVKLFLGLISFFTIPFTKKCRAIHDFASRSIVIYAKCPNISI